MKIFLSLLALCLALPVLVKAETSSSAVASYFPVLPYGAVRESMPQFVPVISNYPLDGEHAGITRAVIVIHDMSRDAPSTLAMLTSLAGPSNATTLIVAPQFLLDSDIAHFSDQLPEQGKPFTRWPLDGWQYGGDSLATPLSHGISSFTILDLILLSLSEKKYFSDLQQIVITGHGAGGDFVQRYAAVGEAPDILDKHGVSVRYVVANPSSYIYFTAPRFKGGRQGFGPIDNAQCPSYNAWPYGLEALNNYGRRTGANAIKLRYMARSVIYLIGEQAARRDPLPDNSCAALFQGTDRVLRAMNYNTYLNVAFGDDVQNTQHFNTVPKTGYDAPVIFASPCGMMALFGNRDCIAAPQR